jgi:hypothetical protein
MDRQKEVTTVDDMSFNHIHLVIFYEEEMLFFLLRDSCYRATGSIFDLFHEKIIY